MGMQAADRLTQDRGHGLKPFRSGFGSRSQPEIGPASLEEEVDELRAVNVKLREVGARAHALVQSLQWTYLFDVQFKRREFTLRLVLLALQETCLHKHTVVFPALAVHYQRYWLPSFQDIRMHLLSCSIL